MERTNAKPPKLHEQLKETSVKLPMPHEQITKHEQSKRNVRRALQAQERMERTNAKPPKLHEQLKETSAKLPMPHEQPKKPHELLKREFGVPPEREGERLDRFLQWAIPRLSRAKIQTLIDKGAVSLSSGRRAKASANVFAGESVSLCEPLHEGNVEAYAGPLPVLFEDDHLCIIDKPAPLACHPSARYRSGTVLDRTGYRLIHRLDRETSGVLLLAKTEEAERAYSQAFRARQMEKRYLAWVVGAVPHEFGIIDQPMRLAPQAKARVRMEIHPKGLSAVTRYEVLLRWTEGGLFTLLALYPETGRQHQLRLHLSWLGYPIAGDKLYHLGEDYFLRDCDGLLTDEDRARNRWPRMLLHAETLTFPHPQGMMTVTAPMPALFQRPDGSA
jgi:23S rRNA pseudouridine1911/1915/1917 synthase